MSRCIEVYTRDRKAGQQCEQEAVGDDNPYCPTHAHWHRAELARKRGLRTIAKPGEPGYKGENDVKST